MILIYQSYIIYLHRINHLNNHIMFFVSITSKFDPKQQKTVLCPANHLEECINKYLTADVVIVITESEVYQSEDNSATSD